MRKGSAQGCPPAAVKQNPPTWPRTRRSPTASWPARVDDAAPVGGPAEVTTDDVLVVTDFNRPDDLSIRDASTLIDDLMRNYR